LKIAGLIYAGSFVRISSIDICRLLAGSGPRSRRFRQTSMLYFPHYVL
jgi:hypothetical protein